MVYAMLGIASDIPQCDPDDLLLPDYFKSETQLVRDLQTFLFFGDIDHQMGQFNDMKAFLAVLPELTDMTFRNSIVDARMENVKMLLERDQQFEIPTAIFSNLDDEKRHSLLQNLSQLPSSNLTLSGDGLESVLQHCEPDSAKSILDFCRGNLEITENFARSFRGGGGKRANRKVWKLLFRRASGSMQVTQGGFAEMAAFCDAKQMKLVIERQRQVYFITSRVAFTISLNGRYGRDIMNMLLTWKDDWVRVTEDGLLTVLKYNDADIVRLLRWRGLRSVKVTGVGTNPSDPEASWVSTVNFDEETLICRREADEVRQKLRESWEGVIEAEVVYIDKSSIMPES
ncbi:hypothetical protein ColLi_06425 [Colletotrichum liriopes]|uniref:Uncharacterized protein n=1 Tax=Colletotrichum liriopes TaxID=708192 RepID=A0AA37GMP6_9PEZI|nr:hypothetical protein ColLi_06425 [Colletotrichum liriopes]